jgi:hypothetical protein
MSQSNLEEAEEHLSELEQRDLLKPKGRKPGTGKGIWMAPDFDDPLDDFRKYM